MPRRRNVLVTGAASGIGRQLAAALADDGDWVLATDVDTEGLAASADEMHWGARGVETRELDVTEPGDWEEALERVMEERGRIDLLIHAAGCFVPGRVIEADPEDIDAQVDVNLKGTMLGTRTVGAVMADQGEGHIVNFGSLASLSPAPGLGIYGGSKFGVRGFSLAAAEELRSEGVAVTVVMPDTVDTPLLKPVAESEDAAMAFSGTILTVEEIEEVIVERVLPDRPLEAAIPPSRGALAKLSTLAPGLLKVLRPLLEHLGRDKQEEFRQRTAE